MLFEVKCFYYGRSVCGWKFFYCYKEFCLIFYIIFFYGYFRVWRYFWYVGYFGYMWYGWGVLFDGWVWIYVVFFIYDVVGSFLVIGWRYYYVFIVSYIFIYVKFIFIWKNRINWNEDIVFEREGKVVLWMNINFIF